MHLLTVTPGEISDGEAAVDLAQTPGDIVILTVADSELACLAKAAARLPGHAPSIRLANLLQLRHPYSVDLYLEKVLARAKFIGVILLGGKNYWPYGIDEIAHLARARGIRFAALANGQQLDPALDAASTVPPGINAQLRDYMHAGGIGNALAFLQTACRLIGADCGAPAAPVPVADAGLYLPGTAQPDMRQLRAGWQEGAPVALLVFYRALMLAGTVQAVDDLAAALLARGFNVAPVYVRSLRDGFAQDWLRATIGEIRPDVILNATSFAAASATEPRQPGVLEAADCPILQIAFAGMTADDWQQSPRGLGVRDLAMNVALPEVDGRIFAGAVAFKAANWFDAATQCAIVAPRVLPDRVAQVAGLARNWARLRRTPAPERRIALVLANYPGRDGRIGNGVGLDTPASAARILQLLQAAGYDTGAAPTDGAALMQLLTAGVTNNLQSAGRGSGASLPLAEYQRAFAALPQDSRARVEKRWGRPQDDPFFRAGAFRLAVHRFGHMAIAIQPSRGYNIDPRTSYHDPDLPPPHGYLAFHFWLRQSFAAHAMVQVGKHGNLEWLPGKAVSLSAGCFPEIGAGQLPVLYPFIVNDPGEGTQAKRRISAVILDHLTPPLTRAENHGALKDLEALVDEYYQAAGMDPRRIASLRQQIFDLAAAHGLAEDAGATDDSDAALARIDNYLCDLKELQIRDGLHIFATSPGGRLRRDLLLALARVPRGADHAGQESLLRALAADLALDCDPLDCDMAALWTGARPAVLRDLSTDVWRSHGDTVERLELLSAALLDGELAAPGAASAAVLREIADNLGPRIDACGDQEGQNLLRGLDGRFVLPGPSGAPTRGRPDVLPTGRNFFSVDIRAIPTAVAYELGWQSAQLLVEDYLQREGEYPQAVALSAWGTANMRTGGDDIAQALALMGVRPRWDAASGHITGFEIVSVTELGRPRVDVTLRVSGFFRDAFPDQIALLDSAARAVMALPEAPDRNPAAARFRAERDALVVQGETAEAAARRAGARVFGSRPGAYGAGLGAVLDEEVWESRADLAEAWLEWGAYAYGAGSEGAPARQFLEARLAQADAVIQNQDNREHDLLDSDDYYQFEGGLMAAIEHLRGTAPLAYHTDHSRVERPVVRTLPEEIGRVVRARVSNPKWIAGAMRHGYKGAFEMAASVDYLFAFAATTNAVRNHHFDAVYQAYIADDRVRGFLADANPAALREMAAKLADAIRRGLWQPRSNSAGAQLGRLAAPQAGAASR